MTRSMSRRCLLIAVLLAQAGGLDAAVLDSSPTGFTVENSVTVPVDAKAAWDGLVNHVNDWWPKDHSWFGKAGKFVIEPRAGGCFCEKAGPKQALHLTVSFVDPGRLLRMIGGLGPLQGMGLTGTLEWHFKPVESGSQITLRYVAGGYTTTDLVKFVQIVDQVQAVQLGSLGTYLSKGKPAPKTAQ
jgi:hypothetical protein